MPLRVIQWATGTVGVHAVPAIVAPRASAILASYESAPKLIPVM